MTKCDLSIILTCHSEGILIHKTLASIRRAIAQMPSGSKTEIIIHADNPTPAMDSYLNQHTNTTLADTQVYRNSFGDLSASRNFAISKANGRYIATIDADDLMSKNWLSEAYAFLESVEYGEYVAHSEMTIEFGGFNSIVQKYGELNPDLDTLLNVWSARWNSVIMAPITFMRDHPYQPNSPGYGYEDWHLSCSFVQHGLHNITIPQTVIFVRRKDESEWARQKSSYSVLRAHPILSLKNFRKLPHSTAPADVSATSSIPDDPFSQSYLATIKKSLLPHLKKNKYLHKSAKKAFALMRHVKSQKLPVSGKNHLPKWLLSEWRDIHKIEKQLFPDDSLIGSQVYHTITPDHYRIGRAYQQIANATSHDNYDYILFVPWLIEGGADLFAINYANYVSKHVGLNVLVIATNETDRESSWSSRLDDSVDFVNLGSIAEGLSIDQRYRLIEQLIENTDVTYLHILNSVLGYDFVQTHATYLTATSKKVIATAYSQSTDESGKVFGFSHTHVPAVYEQLYAITTDNQAVVDMWADEYGFDRSIMHVHHQPIDAEQLLAVDRTTARKQNVFRILWASRLAPEKLPELITPIADELRRMGINVHIDIYGTTGDDGPSPESITGSPIVTYKGGFKDIARQIPLDKYDAFLYTSIFDGTPNTLVEIGLAGIPIVASKVGGIPALTGDLASLVDDIHNPKHYAEQLHQIYSDYESAAGRADKLRKQLKKRHDPATFSRQITGLIKSPSLPK